ncbi:MAG: response regulator [Chloroflexota bacterium]
MSNNNHHKGRVLIVDDDVDFMRINGKVLRQDGYEVVEAYTGADGLEKARETKPDAVLLDFMMESNTEGASVAQALREDPDFKTTPILLVTAVRRIKPWWNGVKPDQEWLPVDKVLDKPVAPERLLAEVREVLSK